MNPTLRATWAAARRAIDARQLGEARVHFDLLMAQPVDDPEAHYEFAWLLRQLGDYTHALRAYQTAIDHGAREPEEIHLNRAVIYTDALHDHAAAERELQTALALRPGYLPALLNLGNLCEDLGRRDDAAQAYRRALAIDGALRLEALARLLKLHVEPIASFLAQAQAALRDHRVQALTRANLAFAVGHALEHLRRYEEAFAAFEQANALAASGGPPYNPARHERIVDALIGATPDIDSNARSDSPTLLFVCGMFRSGSTLIEQVLSAHAHVSSAGELAFFPNLAAAQSQPFPECMANWSNADLTRIADAYRALMQNHCAGPAPHYFVDKRPDNFLLLPLIRRVFPRARILYTRRDPVDNALSAYQQHLDQAAAPYSSSLTGIAHFYAQQERLFAHYQESFRNDLVVFDYERFVADPTTELRRILGELQLDWDPGCLDFHQRPSAVKTASVWQVRQPVHQKSRQRWLPYRRQLAPLLVEFDRLGVAYHKE